MRGSGNIASLRVAFTTGTNRQHTGEKMPSTPAGGSTICLRNGSADERLEVFFYVNI
jgi:hypothetical protein